MFYLWNRRLSERNIKTQDVEIKSITNYTGRNSKLPKLKQNSILSKIKTPETKKMKIFGIIARKNQKITPEMIDQ
jgi:hypothetical protein